MIGLKNIPKGAYVRFGQAVYNSKGALINFKESPEFLKNILRVYKREASELKATSEKIGVPRTLLYKIMSNRRKIRADYLLKICKYLQKRGIKRFSNSYLEKHIYSIECMHGRDIKTFMLIDGKLKKLFPFDLETPEGVKCLTFPYGDGYILKDYSKHIKTGYVNSHKELHEEIIKCVQKTFGDVAFSRRKIKGAYETSFSGILGKIYVESLNYTPGNKLDIQSKTTQSTLDRILNLKKPGLIGAFISQMLDDEGYFGSNTIDVCISAGEIPKRCKKNKRVFDYQCVPLILKQLEKALNDLGVKSKFRTPTPYFDKTKNVEKWCYHLQINGFGNILKLLPYLSIKRINLKAKIRKRFTEWLAIILKIKKLQTHNPLNAEQIANPLGISIKSAANYIKTLEKSGFAKKVNKGKYKVKNGKSHYIQTKYEIKVPNNLKEYYSVL